MKNYYKYFLSVFLLSVLFALGCLLLQPAKIFASENDPVSSIGNVATSSANVNQQTQINIHLFATHTCPHCKSAKEFLKNYVQEQSSVKAYVYYLDGTDGLVNSRLLNLLSQEINLSIGSVPLIIIGKEHLVGFANEQTTGQIINNLVQEANNNPEHQDLLSVLAKKNDLLPKFEVLHELNDQAETLNFAYEQDREASSEGLGSTKKNISETNDELSATNSINLPLIGQINLKSLSLPILAIFLGLLDGFNPCAMWTLVFLISLLLGLKDKKRMWLLGGTFIVASAVIYFLFMSAWLNLFLFIGLIGFVRLVIGVFALGAGIYYLRDFMQNKDGACKVDLGGKKQAVFTKLKEITHRQSLFWALIGIVLLAVAVNMVELLCSAGLPAIFTQTLVLNNLPSWQYYAYLLLYVFFFMLDDLVVFVIAMKTLQGVGLDGKYARYSHLIGGLIMFMIGLAMIFKPELLTFI